MWGVKRLSSVLSQELQTNKSNFPLGCRLLCVLKQLLNFSVPQFLFRMLVCGDSCEFASSLLGNGDAGLESGLPHSQLTCS